jgi:hypothetical protein
MTTMMIGVGFSLIQEILGSSTPSNGLIMLFEKQHLLHENLEVVPRLGDIWLLVKLFVFEGFVKFFKPKHKRKLQEGDCIVKLELIRCETCVLSWKLYKNREGMLVWAYVSSDEVQFNNKIENNMMIRIIRFVVTTYH